MMGGAENKIVLPVRKEVKVGILVRAMLKYIL